MEHITDMPYCWCNPKIEVFPNGNMVIVHNERFLWIDAIINVFYETKRRKTP